MNVSRYLLQILVLAVLCGPAAAQDRGTLDPKPLPPLANPDDPATPAKDLFGRKPTPANMQARAIGFYTRGCLAGGVALPVNGQNWQVMRLSRNRNWGHPSLIDFLERLAAKAPKVGLDADIWLTPMPNRELTRKEREETSATMVVRPDRLDVDPKVWTPGHLGILRAAAQDPAVERVLVNAAIKKALCREAGTNRSWLHKIRPVYGHDYHFHVRMSCPKDSPTCKPQDPTPDSDGCGEELAYWFQPKILFPPPPDPSKPRKYATMKDLPQECRQVLLAQ